MSTTPMHRPFLVGNSLHGHELSACGLAGPTAVSRGSSSSELADRTAVYRGLYLVPASGHRKATRTGPFQDHYKIAAAAAALFLVLTVV